MTNNFDNDKTIRNIFLYLLFIFKKEFNDTNKSL